MSANPHANSTEGSTRQLVVFSLGAEEYALPITRPGDHPLHRAARRRVRRGVDPRRHRPARQDHPDLRPRRQAGPRARRPTAERRSSSSRPGGHRRRHRRRGRGGHHGHDAQLEDVPQRAPRPSRRSPRSTTAWSSCSTRPGSSAGSRSQRLPDVHGTGRPRVVVADDSRLMRRMLVDALGARASRSSASPRTATRRSSSAAAPAGRADARPAHAGPRRPRRAAGALRDGKAGRSRSSWSPPSPPPTAPAPSTRSPRARSTSSPSRRSARHGRRSPPSSAGRWTRPRTRPPRAVRRPRAGRPRSPGARAATAARRAPAAPSLVIACSTGGPQGPRRADARSCPAAARRGHR